MESLCVCTPLRPSGGFSALLCSSLTPPLFQFHSGHLGYTQQQSPCYAVALTLIKPAPFHQTGAPYTALRLDMALGSPGLDTAGSSLQAALNTQGHTASQVWVSSA